MKKKKKKHENGSIALVEEAVHLIRARPGLLSLYYTGSLPFVLALLYFIGDMSRNAFAGTHCVAASLGLAVLYVWMKCWHSVFAVAVSAGINQKPQQSWSFRAVVRLVSAQTIIHSTGLFLLPFSAVLGVPFGWVHAFYHNALVLEYDKPVDLKKAISESARAAKYRPGQNHVVLYVITLFTVFVFFNVGVAIFIFPYILKNYFGIETLFTMSGLNALNTTFVASAAGITFLCVDPLIKTVYTLRNFYGLSVATGDDLKAGLKNISRGLKTLAAVLPILAAGLVFPCDSTAGVESGDVYSYAAASKTPVSPDELDRSIKEVMKRREFAWRMPRKTSEDDEEESKWIKPVMDFFRDILKTVSGWIKSIKKSIQEYIDKLFPELDSQK